MKYIFNYIYVFNNLIYGLDSSKINYKLYFLKNIAIYRIQIYLFDNFLFYNGIKIYFKFCTILINILHPKNAFNI